MSYQRLKFYVENHIAHVVINRPDKLNAIDMQMFDEIDHVSKQLRSRKDVRVAIVSGEGADFCTGIDVKSVLASQKKAMSLLWKWWPGSSNKAQRVSTNWRKVPFPVIMAIHGRCWGGGLQIALGGDFRIATPDASFAIMENKWGLIPDMGGSLALREQLPTDKSMLWAMTAEEISAQDALSTHLITEVADEPLEAAKLMAEKLMNRSPDSIAAIKKLYRQFPNRSDAGLLARESGYQIKVIVGENVKIARKRETQDPTIPYKL